MLYSKEDNDKKAVNELVESLTKLGEEMSHLWECPMSVMDRGDTEEVRKMKDDIKERSNSLLTLERIL